MSSKQIIDGLTSAQRYLEAQMNLFGNTLYREGSQAGGEAPSGGGPGPGSDQQGHELQIADRLSQNRKAEIYMGDIEERV